MTACTFIGHTDFAKTDSSSIYKAIKTLIEKEDVTTFYVGTHGNFDRMVYRCLCQLENRYNIKTIVVLSHLNRTNQYYDMSKTIFPDVLTKTPPRFAITKRNQYMISQSQYMICGVNNTLSNSYRFAKEAQKRGLKVINIGELEEL